MVTEVRRAGLDDRRAIARLRLAWTEEKVGRAIQDDTFEARFDAWLDREHDQRVTWLAVVDGVPVAMLNLLVFTRMPSPRDADLVRPSQWGYLANFFVVSEHRGTRLG
ncbi:MAG: GNAT family N-acetyltransferase, partial [Nocardioides sp.]